MSLRLYLYLSFQSFSKTPECIVPLNYSLAPSLSSFVLSLCSDIRAAIVPASATVSSRDSVTFRCEVVGSPLADISYAWTRTGVKSIPPRARVDGGLLSIDSLHVDDSGQYCCVATVGRETNKAETCAELLVGECVV